MQRRTTLFSLLLVYLSSAGGQSVAPNATCSPTLGPCFNRTVFRNNLQYLHGTVLPEGWKLNAVIKWEGYGNGLNETAAVTTEEGHSVAVLYNDEIAAAASVTPRPVILRILPANYSDLVATIKAGYKTQELASPLNIADLLAAGRDTNTTIPVHLYLYKHYEDAWGWNFTTPQQLQAFVDQLDKRYVQVVGFMMHLSGYPDEQKEQLSEQFLQVVCPVAASLAPQKVAVHWTNSDEALALIPESSKRQGNYSMQPVIPSVCNASNIEYWARLGTAIYGSFTENYADAEEGFGPGTAPVLLWTPKVKAVGQTTLRGGAVRTVATVDVSPARYPAPSWWPDADVFELANSTKATSAGAERAAPDPFGRPPLFVYFNGQRLRLADWPAGNGSIILVDVTDAVPPVVPGDEVGLLCEEQPIGTFGAEVGADEYNMGMCLKGLGSTEGTLYEDSDCIPWARVQL